MCQAGAARRQRSHLELRFAQLFAYKPQRHRHQQNDNRPDGDIQRFGNAVVGGRVLTEKRVQPRGVRRAHHRAHYHIGNQRNPAANQPFPGAIPGAGSTTARINDTNAENETANHGAQPRERARVILHHA